MDAKQELEAKRREVRAEILAIEDKIPSARILDFFGRAFRKRGFGYWFSNFAALNLVFFIPWAIAEWVLNENIGMIPISRMIILALEIGIAGFFTVHLVTQHVLRHIANRVLEKINNSTDLASIALWLQKSLSTSQIWMFTVPFGCVWAFLGAASASVVNHGFIGYGLTVTILAGWMIVGMAVYIPFWVSALAFHLRKYEYDVNAFSPANSEVISILSDMLTKCIYVLAGYFALATLVASSDLVEEQLKTIFAIPFLLIIWAVIITQFFITRSTLSAIASRAKWKTLNRLQAKINAIEAKADLTEKETADGLSRLVDMYERVFASKTSTLDLNSASTLFSQLMLPLLGLFLGNFDKILKLLQR